MKNKGLDLGIKIVLTLMIIGGAFFVGFLGLILSAFAATTSGKILCTLMALALPSLLPLVWLKKRKIYLIVLASVVLAALITAGVFFGFEKYEEKITIDTSPSINVHEYLPFVEDTKIVKLDSKTLKLTGKLPHVDGAAAVFPVYSAFVHAVYPDSTALGEGVFSYTNTRGGYEALAEKERDVFFGAAPSKEQVEYAEQNGTVFKYTQIGTEAFVFFVHKDNPIDSLTVEQIKGIYSGKITNWSELGGDDEEIVAFQRNEGSGSQSMLIRFMGDTPIMTPETKERVDAMGGIIKEVAEYKSKSGSIGFSFRYYVEGIIKNPDIKMISIDGVSPSIENIKSGTYPITTPLYAVTYEDNPNENVQLLLDWILSEEGQYIIEQTGYVGIE